MKYLALLLFSSLALADLKSITSTGGSKFSAVVGDMEISTHSTQHKAEEAVIVALEGSCSVKTCTGYVRQTFELVVIVSGGECGAIPLSWSMPTRRADGSALHPSEIIRYDIELDGELLDSTDGNVLSFTTKCLPPGAYIIRVRTVADQLSDFSQPLEVLVP